MKRLLLTYTIILAAFFTAVPLSAQSIPVPDNFPSGDPGSDVPLVDVPLYSFVPTKDEAPLFTVTDGNDDGITFVYEEESIPPAFTLNVGYVPTDLDESLTTPVLELEDASKLYVAIFTIRGFNANSSFDTRVSLLRVDNGQTGESETAERVLYSAGSNWSVRGERLEVPFGIAEPGCYRLCIRISGLQKTGGVSINDLAVYVKGLSKVPANPGVEIIPSSKGKLRATLTCTMPVLDLALAPLEPLEPVTVTAQTEDDTFTLTALPGETASADFVVSRSGTATIEITPSNAYGAGATLTHAFYIGEDTPQAPSGLRGETSSDNLSMQLHWDGVEETGVNGGYVDTRQVRYRIYRQTSSGLLLLGETPECAYTVAASDFDSMQRYVISVAAVSMVNGADVESKSNPQTVEHLGHPFALPLHETFDAETFPHTFAAEYEDLSTGAAWQNAAELPEECSPLDTTDGVLTCRVDADTPASHEESVARLLLPKVEVKGGETLTFTLRYCAYPCAPAMRLCMRETSGSILTISEMQPEVGETTCWELWTVDVETLPDSQWVQLMLECDLSGDTSLAGVFDTLTLRTPSEEALATCSIAGHDDVTVGDRVTYTITVKNVSDSDGEFIPVIKLTDEDGTALLQQEYPMIRLSPLHSAEVQVFIDVTEEFGECGALCLTASLLGADASTVEGADAMWLTVHDSSLPVVHDLRAGRYEGDRPVILKWGEPDLCYGAREDFEACRSFAVTSQIGLWGNYDLDGRETVEIEGLHWPEAEAPQGWHVFDADYAPFVSDGVLADKVWERFAPYSGRKCLMARCAAQYYEYDCSADWLVSPALEGGSEVSFKARPLSGAFSEWLTVLVSTTDSRLSAFHPLETIELPRSEAWRSYSVALPEDARHVAIAYVSGDAFGVMVDDLTVSLLEPGRRQVESYSVWRTDGGATQQIASGLTELRYVDEEAPLDATYQVVVHVESDGAVYAGPKSNVASVQMLTGVGEVQASSRQITGARGEVLVRGYDGELLQLYSPDGRCQGVFRVEGADWSVRLSPGIYIARTSETEAKVMVR